uniref:Putative secreted protein n=1 Tax=Anopheles darlingi TaxID=43151 RepID=A0A2M4DAQ9_ANODA
MQVSSRFCMRMDWKLFNLFMCSLLTLCDAKRSAVSARALKLCQIENQIVFCFSIPLPCSAQKPVEIISQF